MQSHMLLFHLAVAEGRRNVEARRGQKKAAGVYVGSAYPDLTSAPGVSLVRTMASRAGAAIGLPPFNSDIGG